MNRSIVAAPVAAVLAGCCCLCREPAVEVSSPDGRNVICVRQNPLRYSVSRDGMEMVAETEIDMTVDGLSLAAAACSPRVVVRRNAADGAVSEASPVYKKGKVDLTCNEKFLDFGDWGLAIVARNDGVAYRFEIARRGDVRVDGEKAGFTVPDPSARCWLNFTNAAGCEETVPQALAAKDVTTEEKGARAMIYLPFAYSVEGKTVAVTESDLFDYPILCLKRAEAGRGVAFGSHFARWPAKTTHLSNDVRWKRVKVEKGGRWVAVEKEADCLVQKTAGSRVFPWRVFALADEPCRLFDADIVWALARPPAPGQDFSWVKPGKVAWDWWNAWNLEGVPFKAGCNTKSYEYFIDFAARTGVEYVIFDEGWSEKLDIWRFSPDVDVPHLIKYANERGVGIILWMAWAQAYGDEARVVEHFANLGAKGFKVDFMDRGDADCERFLWKFAEECRKHRMLVDYHGAHRPTGMSRAYPNVLNYEGIYGLEQMKWFKISSRDMMANDVRACFLRLTAGPMDYTPGAMDNYPLDAYKGKHANPGSVGTRCRQMAMMALYEAPLQMLCDSPTKYERNMECFNFMAATPVVWDDTTGIGGSPDTFAAVARKAKDGSWYAAGIACADACDFTLDTSAFLGGDGAKWKAEAFFDAPESDKEPMKYRHQTQMVVKAGDKIAVHMAPGGGFVVRFSK